MDKSYQVIETKDLPQLQSQATLYAHSGGAKVIHIKNNDRNKVFSVTFKTPPYDDTGVFHIMEHSVLAGSRKYPVKEPFNELIKGSLYTYLNAMTFSDKTMYPIGSCNDRDFFNLMAVYLDAVFFPKIYERRESFLQEGWRDQLTDKNSPVTRSGIVYSEMKGAYADPLRVLDAVTNKTLFSETAYRFDSGGDPDCIPALDYDRFLAAHRHYYHPSNSYIYFYGDMDIEKCFALLHDDYLSHFPPEKAARPITIGIQPERAAPGFCASVYPIAAGEAATGKTILAANWIVGDYNSAEDCYAFQLLAQILAGTPASPIKKMLLDGGFGEEVLGGFDADLLQTVFHITVKQSDKRIEAFQAALERALSDLAANGIDPRLVRACLSQAEFLYREADFGARPKGLVYNIITLSGWLHGGDPFEKLESLRILSDIRAKVATEPYFERLIETRLLHNPNRVFSAIEPAPGLNEKKEQARQKALADYKKNMTEEETAALIAQTAGFAAFQEKKDSPADLQKIPFVSIRNIPEEPERIPFARHDSGGFDCFHTDLWTNGILYIDLMFSTDAVPPEQRYAIGVLAFLLGKLSTKSSNYEDLSNRVHQLLGGFSVEFQCVEANDKEGRFAPYLRFRAKCLKANAAEPFRLADELIRETLFDDRKRMAALLNELKSRLRQQVTRSGHLFAVRAAEARQNAAGAYREAVSGISFYEKVCAIAARFDAEADALIQDLSAVIRLLFQRHHFKMALTCERADFDVADGAARAFFAALDDACPPQAEAGFYAQPLAKAYATAARVQYNALAAHTFDAGYTDSGYRLLLSNIISRVYLMEELRMKGGAYGFGAAIRPNGLYHLYSYRDPHLTRTYAVYARTTDFIERFQADANEMRKHILGAVNMLDRQLSPQAKGELALKHFLAGKTFETQRQERAEILGAQSGDIKKYAAFFAHDQDSVSRCTIGNNEKIAATELFDIVQPLC